MGASTRVLFLDAADDVLVRRYEESRRKHPLAADDRVSDGHRQRAGSCSRSSRATPTSCSTPSDLNVHELRDRLARAVRRATSVPARCRRASCRSATSTGCPLDVDLVFDCRFLPNPHWVEELRPLTGTDARGARLRAGPAGDRAVPRRAASGCSRCCSPRTCARASRTCRSASAAPAAATAAS